MSSKSQLVGAAGVGLIAANFWTGPNRAALGAGLFSKNPTSDAQDAAHEAFKQVGIELLAVAVLTIVASTSDNLASACLAIIVALFILWAMTHYGAQPGTNAAVAPGAVKSTSGLGRTLGKFTK